MFRGVSEATQSTIVTSAGHPGRATWCTISPRGIFPLFSCPSFKRNKSNFQLAQCLFQLPGNLADAFDLIVDAIFGFSFSGEVRPPFDAILRVERIFRLSKFFVIQPQKHSKLMGAGYPLSL